MSGKVGYLFLVALVLAGCAAAPTASPTRTPASSRTPTSSPTSTKTPNSPATDIPELTLTAYPTIIPLTTAEPFVTAKYLRFDSWSPDSLWFAFWQSEEPFEISAVLVLANIGSGEICVHEEVPYQIADFGYLLWQADGSLVAYSPDDDLALGGLPCQVFAGLSDFSPPEVDVQISPDGRYCAEYLILEMEEQLMHGETTITDLDTGQTVLTLQWDTGINFGHRAGPSWLNNVQFLIGRSFEQGWIYAALPNGRIGMVLPELFGLDAGIDEHVEGLFSQADPLTGEYHLMAEGGLLPSILLYHSELGLVEEIPFKGAWSFTMHAGTRGFSPDGNWMMFFKRVGEERPEGQIGEDFWVRRVDPPGGEYTQISDDLGGVLLSPDGGRMALFSRASIFIACFPNAQYLSRWGASSYEVSPVQWSPDGKWLVAHGFHWENGTNALFIFSP